MCFLKPFVGTPTGLYDKIIKSLLTHNMVCLRTSSPKVINGLFAVPNGGEFQRRTIDARNAKLVFQDPLEEELPDPGMLAELQLKKNEKLLFSKSDLVNFFHTLKLPDWMNTYFGVPSIREIGKEL